MSYAIANIIYGVPLVVKVNGTRTAAMKELIEEKPEGVLTFYSGQADITPAAFGVLVTSFDECVHHTELGGPNIFQEIEITVDHMREWDRIYDLLTDEQKMAIYPAGQLRVFILWSTS